MQQSEDLSHLCAEQDLTRDPKTTEFDGCGEEKPDVLIAAPRE